MFCLRHRIDIPTEMLALFEQVLSLLKICNSKIIRDSMTHFHLSKVFQVTRLISIKPRFRRLQCVPTSFPGSAEEERPWERGSILFSFRFPWAIIQSAGKARENWYRRRGRWEGWQVIRELALTLIGVFFSSLSRLSRLDSKRSRSRGNRTWLLCSRQPNKTSFPIRKSLTAAFVTYQWSLDRESCSGNVCTDSAGQRLIYFARHFPRI